MGKPDLTSTIQLTGSLQLL